MRHLLGLVMVMAILAISLIRPNINESIVELNRAAAKSCKVAESNIDAHDQVNNSLTLEEVWQRCNPEAKSDQTLTSGFILKFSFD